MGWGPAGLQWDHTSELLSPQRVLEQLRQQGCSYVVFTDCQRDSNVKKVLCCCCVLNWP